MAHGLSPQGRGTTWLSGLDPSAPAALVELASSPAVQHIAASVTAGLLALGITAAVVRDGDTRTADPGRAAAEVPVSAPPVTTRGPATGGTPAEPATTTTVAPAATDPPASATSPTVVTTTTTAPAAPASAPAATASRAFVPAGRLPSAPASVVAHAVVAELPVYDQPGTAPPRLALANPQRSGAPLVLLVTEQRPGWLQVLLPVRPNGSTGWVRADQTQLVTHNFRIVVELGAHRITAYQGTEVLLSEPVAVGTSDAPTPGGLYYTKELIQPVDRAGIPDPDGPYGPYAYGLSGFSEVLYEFAGGDGQFGIHGTNQPSLLGGDVSHGCIRMSNEGITFLAGTLPLGVPVEIWP